MAVALNFRHSHNFILSPKGQFSPNILQKVGNCVSKYCHLIQKLSYHWFLRKRPIIFAENWSKSKRVAIIIAFCSIFAVVFFQVFNVAETSSVAMTATSGMKINGS
jgi:hypothetical protein